MVSTRKTAHPDASTVIDFTTEMVASTQSVIDSLSLFSTAPQVKPVSNLVQGIADTARLIGLRSVALLAEEIVHFTKQMEMGSGPAIQSEVDVVKGALSALHRYLVSASSGRLSSGLSLHAAYTEIARSAPGRVVLNRGEIFLPVFPLVGTNSATYNEGKFVAEIARYQDEFHQTLLRYKEEKNIETINAMRTALVTMETKNPSAEFKVFFGLAIAYFDIALRSNGKISKEDEGLLVRIDRELADIVRGDLQVDEATLSWFLYVIAQASQFSVRIRNFQEVYDLTRIVEQEPSGIVSEQTLSSARTALDNARRSWESAFLVNGDIKAAKSSTFVLVAVCNTIGDQSLKIMSLAMGALAEGVSSEKVEANPETAVFGASILLAVGDRLDSIVNDPKGGRATADFHKERVQAVLSGKKPSELGSRAQMDNQYPQEILDEVHNNISAAESIVDFCVREGIKEHKADEAIKLLSSASSAMMFINLMDGAEFADRVTGHVKATLDLLHSKSPVLEKDIMLMAESVMLLDRYVKLVPVDIKQANMALHKGMAMFDVADEAEVEASMSQDEGPFDVPDDDDDGLAEIFYEETEHFINDKILPSIEKLKSNLGDSEAFLEMRRGFHTIKGSARMVGLKHTGDVAQHAEHALNIIRDNKAMKLVPDMLVWLSGVCTLVSQTVINLKSGLPAKVDQTPHKAIYEAFASTGEFSLAPAGQALASIEAIADSSKLGQEVRTSDEVLDDHGAADVSSQVDLETQRAQDAGAPVSVEMTQVASTSDLVLEEPLDPAKEAPALENSLPERDEDPVREDHSSLARVGNEMSAIQPSLTSMSNEDAADASSPVVENQEIEVVSLETKPSASEDVLNELNPSEIEKPLDLNLAEAPPDPGRPPEVPQSTLIEGAPLHKAAEEIPELPASVNESSSSVEVGDVSIPTLVYQAFIEEAGSFYKELEKLLREMIQGSRTEMHFEVIRYSHSLAGMGRTTGLTAITDLASLLESWASLKQDQKLNLDDDTIDILRRTLEALEAMIMGVSDGIEPMGDSKLVKRLKDLVSKEEHHMAFGQQESSITASVMERIEAGGGISDSGPQTKVAAESASVPASVASVPTPASVQVPVSVPVSQAKPKAVKEVSKESSSVSKTIPKTETKQPAKSASKDATNKQARLAVNTPEAVGSRFRPQHLAENDGVVEGLVREIKGETMDGPASDSINTRSNPGGDSTVQAVPASQDRFRESGIDVSGDLLDEISSMSRNGVPVIPESALVIGESISRAPESTNVPSNVDMEEFDSTSEGDTVYGDLDEVPVTQDFANQMQAEADALTLSPRNDIIEALDSTDQVDVVGYSDQIIAQAPFVQEMAMAVQSPSHADEIQESLPDVIVESTSLHRPEAIFIAPKQGEEGQAVVIGESISRIPATLEMDVGTTTVMSSGHEGSVRSKTVSKNKGPQLWYEIVCGKEDDIADEMKEIFIQEADERFIEIDTALSGLAEDLSNKKLTNSLKRSIHTLKGSANTTGARKTGAIFHYLEDLMNEAPVLNSALCETVQSGVDAAFASVEALKNGKSINKAVGRLIAGGVPSAAGDGVAEAIAETASELPPPSTQNLPAAVGEPVALPAVTMVEVNAEVGDAAVAARTNVRAPAKDDDSTMLRVSTGVLDRMVKSMGEINISRTRVGMNVDLTKMQMSGMAASLDRMYENLRQIEMEAERQMHAGTTKTQDLGFDALQMDRFTRLQELTRRVAEAQNDVMMQQNGALSAIRDMEEAVATQRILISEVSGELDRVRQVRVSNMVPHLKRVVRSACRDTGKKGEIYFDADVEIDRSILEKMTGPIEHILRNAVAHGIESPSSRIKANKDETGSIEFRAYQDGNEVVIEIHDDGNGIDSGKVLQKAVERGLVKPGARMPEDKIRELLFEPGFSTAETVSDVAGRGVGLDVVRSEISAIGGRVDIQSAIGSGTTFVLRLPATLTVISGVSVSTETHMYVIPVSFIDRLVRVSSKELDMAYKSQKLTIKETSGEQVVYDFWGMWQVVGVSVAEKRTAQRGSIILMRGDRIAVHVDDIRPATEFVFRPMGPQLVANSGLIGSTINSSGNAALVLDPARVVRNLKTINAKMGKGGSDARSSMQQQARVPLILIVDDSTTVRKVTTRLLKKEGLRYEEAENGMQALEKIQNERPDVILMDIEMPVMNGYEATQAIRATPDISGIPIIMITSRVGESHRQKAIEIGVNDYLGKPYNDFDLMAAIRRHTQDMMEKA